MTGAKFILETSGFNTERKSKMVAKSPDGCQTNLGGLVAVFGGLGYYPDNDATSLA